MLQANSVFFVVLRCFQWITNRERLRWLESDDAPLTPNLSRKERESKAALLVRSFTHAFSNSPEQKPPNQIRQVNY